MIAVEIYAGKKDSAIEAPYPPAWQAIVQLPDAIIRVVKHNFLLFALRTETIELAPDHFPFSGKFAGLWYFFYRQFCNLFFFSSKYFYKVSHPEYYNDLQ